MSFISSSSNQKCDLAKRALSQIEKVLSDLASNVFEPEFFELAKQTKISVLDIISTCAIEESFVLENLDLRLKDFYLIISAESDYKIASLIHEFYSNIVTTYYLSDTSLNWFCEMIIARSLYWVDQSFVSLSSGVETFCDNNSSITNLNKKSLKMAILRHFPNKSKLEIILTEHFDRSIAFSLPLNTSYDIWVYHLIQSTEAKGSLNNLITALSSQNPAFAKTVLA